MNNKGVIKMAPFHVLFFLIGQVNCQALFHFDLQYKTIDFNIKDEDFQGNQNRDKSVSYGLWSRYNPLSTVIQVGNVGMFDSNCFHYINVADKVTKRINMIYYDCMDFEKNTITKKVEFIDEKYELHVFELNILSSEYENAWYLFFMISWPYDNKFKILFQNHQGVLIYEELNLKFPFCDKNLTITFGGGLDAYYNDSEIKYSFFPGILQLFWYQQIIQDWVGSDHYIFYDPSLTADFYECENNGVYKILEQQIFSQGDISIYNSKFPNVDYFYLIGWIRILQVINPKSDQNYKIIKISANSMDNRLQNDDLSPFQLYYKISNEGNSMIFTTYSYIFPTVNLNALNKRFLITSEFKLSNNIQNWHYLSVTLRQNQLTVQIEFYEGLLSQVYTETIQVQQFKFVNFALKFGNLVDSMDSYLNIEMRMISFSNCDQITLQKCISSDCSFCIGPTTSDCQSCLQDTKKVYLPETKQCVCSLDNIEESSCLNLQDIQLNVANQINEQFSCPYGYFTVDSECFQCPSIISESQITCLECLINPLIWHTMLYCSSQLVSYNGDTYTYEYFNKMYYVFDGAEIQYCKYCTNICTSDCIYNHFQTVKQQDAVKCSLQSAFNHQDCFQCDFLNCKICKFSISKGKYCVLCYDYLILSNGKCMWPNTVGVKEFCFDNCSLCDLGLCYSCYPPYYLNSDKTSCKKCPIQNCQYCFEYKTNDITKNTIFKDFDSFEIDDFFSIGCSLCYDGYNFDFSSKRCIKGFPKTENCIRSYVDLSGQEKCLLSAINDFSIAPQIINCGEHINNCEQCVITPFKDIRCIICKSGYGSQIETGLCDICSVKYSKVCIQEDYDHSDYWVQLIQSFIIQFFQDAYFYPSPSRTQIYDFPFTCVDGYYPTIQGLCFQYCDSQCLVCVERSDGRKFLCKECPKNQFGIRRLSNTGENCLECPKLCLSCIIRSDDEIKRINPQFVVTAENRIYTQICLRQLQDYRIKLDQQTQIAYYCFEETCSRSLEQQFNARYVHLMYEFDQAKVDYCNQMGIKEFHLTFNFAIKNINQQIRYYSNNPIFVYNLKSYIFTLKTTILSLIRTEQQDIGGNLQIQNFDRVLFQDIIYYLSYGNQIKFLNSDDSVSLHLKNTFFIGDTNQQLNFIMHSVLFNDLIFDNVTLYNLNLKNIIWLEYMSNLDENIVQISQLRIENCSFSNITLFSFIQYTKHINFQHIYISNSNFSFSTLLQFNITDSAEVNFISGVEIKNCLFNYSTFIKNTGDKDFRITDIVIYQNRFYNSFLINTDFKTTLINVKIEKNFFSYSTFFKSAAYVETFSSIDFYFQDIIIKQNIFDQSKLFNIYQQNQTDIQIYADSFIQDDYQQDQIQFFIENQSSPLHLYDFQCTLLSINNFTFNNTQNSSYFKVYQTNKIIFANTLFSNKDQKYRISDSAACNLDKKTSPVLIYVQGFSEINLQNISIFNQFSIDSSLIKIQSDLLLQSFGTELIKIQEITFRSNILVKYNLANLFSLLVIYSERVQNIYMRNLTFQENFFHQIIDDPSSVGAGLFYLNSFQSLVEVDGITCLCNSMTNSSYSFIALNSLTISFNKFQVTNHNFQSHGIWEKYYQIQLDLTYSEEVVHQLIDQFFGIKTKGGILQIFSQLLIIQNAYFSNIRAQSSVALSITTQGQGVIQILDVQIIRAYVMLLQTNLIDGCITISSVNSVLNLLLQNVNFQSVHNRFGSAILTIYPSLKQNSIILMNITVNNSFSLLNQLVKIQFSTTSSETNNFQIKNLNFLQSQHEFTQYLQTINFPSVAEIRKIKGENSIINLKGCTIKIKNLKVTGILISPILIVNDTQQIIMQNLQIQFVEVLFPCRLLSFTFSETNVQTFIVENIIFHLISQVFPDKKLTTEITQKFWFSFKINECILSPYILQTVQTNQNINSFIDYLNQVYQSQGSFVFIEGLTQLSKVTFKGFDIRNNNCSFCYDGLIQIQQLIPSTIIINNLLCQQNYILKYGCLSLKTEKTLDISQQDIVIKNSRFVLNQGETGVGLFISNTPFIINNTLFLRNNGSEIGGAIMVTNILITFSLKNTIIIENSASFGGGVNMQGSNYLSKNNFDQSLILFNQAQILSNNLVEAPDHLMLQINNQKMSSIIVNQVDGLLHSLYLKPYKLIEQGKTIMTNYLFLPSNQKIQSYQLFYDKNQQFQSYISQFSLLYQNSLNEIQEGEEKDYCQLFTRDVSEDFEDVYSNYTFIQNFSFQLKTIDFDLSGITVKFDPYTIQKRLLQLLFKCYTTSGQKELHYQMNAKTFKCQLGEFYTNNGCQYCEPNYGFYSVEYDVVKCSIFDVNKVENITSNQLKLKIGYWRPNHFSNEIGQCFKGLEYCIGGWKVSNDLCYKGHVGGLCEECDQFNIRGDGFYVKINNAACGNCFGDSTLLPFFFIFLWSFISILFTLRSIRKTNKTFVILKNTTQLFEILFKLTQDFEGIFLKMLLNYLWLFSVIFAFNMTFSLTTIDSISNPNVSMATNLDCQLLNIGKFQLIYLRIFAMIILLIIQIVLILVGFIIHSYLVKIHFDYSVISNVLIYLYVSNQAQLIKSLCSLVAVRTISGIDYIQGDVSLLFYDKDHITWIYVLILPSLIITGLLIPLLFFVLLFSYRNKFSQSNFRKHLGYLFNEYNQEYSYWEQSKILQRSIIILIITYFETDIYTKASLMSLTLIAYILLASSRKPYILKSLNIIDFESCCTILISIFLATVQHISQQSNNQSLSMILQMIILLLCLRICYCFVSRIVILYYKKYESQFFFHMKNVAQQFFSNQIVVIYLNQHYARILLRKQKLKNNYEKLREWRNQFRYQIPNGYDYFIILENKQHLQASLTQAQPKIIIRSFAEQVCEK